MPKHQKKPVSEYEKLRAIWYKKLEDSGFQDIEQDEDNLKVWSSRFSRKRPMELWESRSAYYHMADSFLIDYKFANKTERLIWQRHADAISIRDIVKELNKSKATKTNRTTVWLHIKRLEATMKNMYVTNPE